MFSEPSPHALFAASNNVCVPITFVCVNINGVLILLSTCDSAAKCITPFISYFANKYGYSSTYLGKIFHKITGVSFSNYLLNARINKAKLLLKTTDYTISEIADELGYYDTSHFINQFKKIVGCSPNAYR